MKHYLLVFLLLAGTTSLFQSGSDCDQGILFEKDGMVIVEAEFATLSEGWETSDQYESSGSGISSLSSIQPTRRRCPGIRT